MVTVEINVVAVIYGGVAVAAILDSGTFLLSFYIVYTRIDERRQARIQWP